MKTKVLLSSCCSFLVLATGAGAAAAQSAGGGGAAAAASPAADQGSTIGEVIVTAQRRAERLQDVPITITNVTAQQLKDANIQNLGQIQKVTPALRFDNSGPFWPTTIRGVGSSIVN